MSISLRQRIALVAYLAVLFLIGLCVPAPARDEILQPRQQREPAATASVGGPKHGDGSEVQCDLPDDMHVRNRGGSDTLGLCVFASMKVAGHWQNEVVFREIFEFMFTRPGGGWPAKVDQMVAEYCKAHRQPKPDYLQIETTDLALLRQACRTGRLPAVTYAHSPTGRYRGERIAHMVSLLAAGVGKGPDGRGWWVILDNNMPGEKQLEWMSEADFRRTWTGGSNGWAIILLKPGPPPVPKNATVPREASVGQRLSRSSRSSDEATSEPTEKLDTFGVVTEKLANRERFSFSGVEISHTQARAVLGLPHAPSSQNIPEDETTRRLTVIGPQTLRDRVLHDLDKADSLARWRGKLILSSYDPAHWHVSRVGFVTRGKPTIYVQAANGVVLHRQDDYDDAAGGLATALRRLDPSYRPEEDVDQRKQKPEPVPVPRPIPAPVPSPSPAPLPVPSPSPAPTERVPWSVWVMAGVGVIVFFVGGRKS
jgi:hypothetical protein